MLFNSLIYPPQQKNIFIAQLDIFVYLRLCYDKNVPVRG